MRRTGPVLAILGVLLIAILLWTEPWGGGAQHLDDEPGAAGTRTPPTLLGARDGEPPDAGAESEQPPPEPRAVPKGDPAHRHEVRGVVLGEESRPVVSVPVHLRSLDHPTVVRIGRTGKDGRFRFGKLPSGSHEIAVVPGGRFVYRPQTRTVMAGHAVRFVLVPYPYVNLVFVDMETREGLRTRRIEVVMRVGERESTLMRSESDVVPPRPKPFRHRWVMRSAHATQLQLRARGYEPSPWIDAPREPEPRDRIVEMRHDPDRTGRIVITLRTDDGVALDFVMVSRFDSGGSMGFGEKVVDGRLTLPADAGTNHLQIGEREGRPAEPYAWYVPVSLKVDVRWAETVRREVVLRRGGFVRLKGAQDGEDIVFQRGETILDIDAARDPEKPDTDPVAGPLEAGSWQYRYTDDDTDEEMAGSVVIVAGKIVDSTPGPKKSTAKEGR